VTDYALGATIYKQFTTRSFSSGVPTQLGGSPALSVREEGNATPITSGVSVTVDACGVTGLNEAVVVATGGNGFESGKDYCIYISTGTVGGVSVVGEVVATFSVEKSAAYAVVNSGTHGNAALKTIIDTKASQTSVDDLPTNAELSTALAAADDAVLAAIAGLNDLSAAGAQVAAEAALAAYGASTFNPAADTVEGAITYQQSHRLMNAAAGGKASGLDTTNAKYRDLADTKHRIDATVDEFGNRTAVTLDLT